VLISVFTVALGLVVTTGTAASADNRARVSASGLAERELDMATALLGASPDAAQSLRGEEVNPNLPAEMTYSYTHPGGTDPDPDFPFKVDGEAYRVLRTVEPRTNAAGGSCLSVGSVVGDLGDLVTVTVTWASMSAGTASHVIAEYVPRHRDASTASDPDRAIVAVEVAGQPLDGVTARAGVSVRVAGNGAPPVAQTTDHRGCAAFEVMPAAVGSDYEITLLGGHGAAYVDLLGQSQPVKQISEVVAGGAFLVKFTDYDKAAQLTVTVLNVNPSIHHVFLEPMFAGGGDTIQQPVKGSAAAFTNLYPGSYVVRAGLAEPVAVALAPGENRTDLKVVIP
jgi:hypothetical protein